MQKDNELVIRLTKLRECIKEQESKLERINQLGTLKAGVSDDYLHDLQDEYWSCQREYNSILDQNPLLTSQFAKLIIDSFDDRWTRCRKYRILEPVEVNIEKRLRETSRYEKNVKIGETEQYEFFFISDSFIRRDKGDSSTVYFGDSSISLSAIFNGWLYWYEPGGILSDKFIYRRSVDGQRLEKLDWLSNEKTWECLGDFAHCVSEDDVRKMYPVSGALAIDVFRETKNETYTITVTDVDGKLKVERTYPWDSTQEDETKNAHNLSNATGETAEKKTKSMLSKNPFFVLEVLPTDNRRMIISKAEEKAFFADGNECEAAQSDLLNPTRRLSAELDWFFAITAKDQAEIIESIKSKREICADGLSGISRLNAVLHNFSVFDFDDYFELGYAILEIDELYEELDSSNVCDVINKHRTQSGIALATENDIVGALSKKRTAIRQIISERLESLSEADYVELVLMIAETCIAEDTYNDGVVIGDIIDRYEVRMKSVIDEKMDAALAIMGKVDSNTNKPVIDLTVKNLISILEEFDKYAQPLQIKSAVDGVDHEQSLHLARECRAFAIKLHNECENSDASFKLIHALREIFPELTEFSEIIASDEKQITKIKKEKEQFKKDLEANRQANKRYTVDIRGDRFAIPPYCTCCMKPTGNKERVSYSMTNQLGSSKTTRTIAVDLPICFECLEHQTRYKRLLTLICAISVVVGSVLMSVLMAVGVDGFLSFLWGFGVAVGAYYGISAVWNTKPLAHEHARRGKSARIFSLFFGSVVTFTFYNWEYAHLFRAANKDIASEVIEAPETNTARSTSVLKANEHPVANMFKMIGVFIAVSVIIGSIMSSVLNSSNRDWGHSNSRDSDYSGPRELVSEYYKNTNQGKSSSSTNAYTITLDKQGGTGGTSDVKAVYSGKLPQATAPVREGYVFQGYYSQADGLGTKYYDSGMNAVANWYRNSNGTLYAYWTVQTTDGAETYTITLDEQGGSGGTTSVKVLYGAKLPEASAPSRSGYVFKGYFSQADGQGTKYYDSKMNPVSSWFGSGSETLYAYWVAKTVNKILLTADNFEDYFTITGEGEYVGDMVTITYTIEPKSDAYAKESYSSNVISVELGGRLSIDGSALWGTTSEDAHWREKQTITLHKSQNYTASGKFSFSFYGDEARLYWILGVTNGFGVIAK